MMFTVTETVMESPLIELVFSIPLDIIIYKIYTTDIYVVDLP